MIYIKMLLFTLMKLFFNVDYYFNIATKVVASYRLASALTPKLIKYSQQSVVPVWSKSRYYLEETLRNSIIPPPNSASLDGNYFQ